ncbi:hypothetical protein [Nocardia lijiangensis]|uniref:hypothetical protein n=1 Tax=Nocardia lijiangensis TaxID=299618 RepID=UPI00082D0762|nr:hypothetical protein [Nocardia lijiangensis]
MTKTTTTIQTDADPFDAILTGLGHLILGTVFAAALVVKWAILFPVLSIPTVLVVLAGVALGWPFGVGFGVVFAAGIMLWRWKRPEMFERWITTRARHRFLTWFRYRRRWTRLLTACHLTVTTDDRTTVPRLLDVRIGDSVDLVRVRMLPGHCPADWENRTDHLAHAFGAQECRATITGPATVELAFRHGDSLADPIALPHIDGGLDWGKEAA